MSERKTSVSLLGNRKSKSKFIPTELKRLFICRAEGQLDEVWTIMWTCQTEDRPPLCLRAAWSLNTQIRRSFVPWLIFSKVQAKELEIRAFSCLPAPFSFFCVCERYRETHSLQRHVPRLSFFRVCQPHCHEDAVDQDGQQDEETKQSVSVKEKLSDALKQFFTCKYDTSWMEVIKRQNKSWIKKQTR